MYKFMKAFTLMVASSRVWRRNTKAVPVHKPLERRFRCTRQWLCWQHRPPRTWPALGWARGGCPSASRPRPGCRTGCQCRASPDRRCHAWPCPTRCWNSSSENLLGGHHKKLKWQWFWLLNNRQTYQKHVEEVRDIRNDVFGQKAVEHWSEEKYELCGKNCPGGSVE